MIPTQMIPTQMIPTQMIPTRKRRKHQSPRRLLRKPRVIVVMTMMTLRRVMIPTRKRRKHQSPRRRLRKPQATTVMMTLRRVTRKRTIHPRLILIPLMVRKKRRQMRRMQDQMMILLLRVPHPLIPRTTNPSRVRALS